MSGADNSADAGGGRLVAAWRRDWATRPWWMSLIFYFCIYMTFIYMPFDLFWKPVAEDHEIWFGFSLEGWWAKATAPLHWLIYGAGAYGFWKMSRWMWPWAAVYTAQVVIAMLVWNLVNPRGGGLLAGLIAAAVFAVPMVALWRSRALWGGWRADKESGGGRADGQGGGSLQV